LLNSTLNSSQEVASRLLIVQTDLMTALEEFPRESTGIKILAQKMSLSDKTLKRIVKGTHTPSYQTILKIYRYLLGTKNDRETVLSMPHSLSTLMKVEHDNMSLLDEEISFTDEIDSLLKNDSIFRAIYVETAAGKIHKNKIGYDFGQHGLKVLEKMVQLNIVKEIESDFYTTSVNRGSLSPETAYELSKYLLDNKFSSEKSGLRGENFYSLYFESVNSDTYNEILKIDWESMQKKKALLSNKDNIGNIKLWTINYTDTLSGELIYGDSKEVLQ